MNLNWCLVVLGVGMFGCSAVYPEIRTNMVAIPATQALDPAAPEGLHWVRFIGAKLPPRSRDGRTWEQVTGGAVHSYAVLKLDGKEILRTANVEGETPVWEGSPGANIVMRDSAKLRIELWAVAPLKDHPISIKEMGIPRPEDILEKRARITFEPSGELELAFEPAHAFFGLGFWYELRQKSVVVTRVMGNSPASRAGLLPKDTIVKLAGVDVSTLDEGEIRSKLNAISPEGLPASVTHADGQSMEVTLLDGPIYPTFEEYGFVP